MKSKGRTSSLQILSSNHLFEDFDAYREHIEGWETELVQLSPGALRLELHQLRFPDMRICRLRANQRIADTVTVQKHWLVFVVCFSQKVFCGIPVSPVSLVTVGPGRDYRNLLHEDWESFSITLPPRLLEECVPGISDWTRDDFAPERSVIPLPAPLATKFHRLSRSLFPEVRPVGNFGDRLWLSERLWNEAIRDKTLGLIGQSIAIAGSIAPGQHPKRLRGYLLVERALSYLDAHDLGEDDTVAHLVEELRCGRRTLELAFRNVLGCSPRQYWMALRLNSVRRYLVRQGAGITVTEAAQREGFMHLGRFASQYYRLYGELPSTTLGRATDLRTSAL